MRSCLLNFCMDGFIMRWIRWSVWSVDSYFALDQENVKFSFISQIWWVSFHEAHFILYDNILTAACCKHKQCLATGKYDRQIISSGKGYAVVFFK